LSALLYHDGKKLKISVGFLPHLFNKAEKFIHLRRKTLSLQGGAMIML